MTSFKLEAGVKSQIQYLGKIPRLLQVVFTSQAPRRNGKGDLKAF